jgi:hypothetical protein
MPVTMQGYGQSYMPTGTPDLGASIYSAQRGSVNFARMVELQRLNLQKRALRQQAAAQAAQLKERRQEHEDDTALQLAKFALEERRLDIQDQENQRRSDGLLREYEQAETQRLERLAQDALDERNKLTQVGATMWDGNGTRPARYYTDRLGNVWNLDNVNMDQVRSAQTASRQNEAQIAEATRKEKNMLAEKGARPLTSGKEPKENEYLHVTPDGQRYAVLKRDSSEEDEDRDPRVSKTNPDNYSTKETRDAYVAKYGKDVLAIPAEVVVETEGKIDEEAKLLGVFLEDGTMNLDDLDKLRKLAEYEKDQMKKHGMETLEHNYGTLYRLASLLKELNGLTTYSDEKRVKEMLDDAHKDYEDSLRSVESQSDAMFASKTLDETLKRIKNGKKRYDEITRELEQYTANLIEKVRSYMPKTFGR